jgi:hypothetical protein
MSIVNMVGTYCAVVVGIGVSVGAMINIPLGTVVGMPIETVFCISYFIFDDDIPLKKCDTFWLADNICTMYSFAASMCSPNCRH